MLSPSDYIKNDMRIIAYGKSIHNSADAYTWDDIYSEDSIMKYTHDTNYDELISRREQEDALFKIEQLRQHTNEQLEKLIHKLDPRANIIKNVLKPIKTDIKQDMPKKSHQNVVEYKKSRNDFIYPIVLLHGITSNKKELSSVVDWLSSTVSNEVYNLEIGNGKFDSIFKPMNWQLDQLCAQIYSMSQLAGGFHFIGMSQGGLLARGYVEKCNKYPVINLITWVSPHGGVYGLGDIDIDFSKIYTEFFQTTYSFAGYWKDPFRYEEYLNKSSYLPFLNNESKQMRNLLLNRDNMLSLKNFVMIWSPNDDVISPPESGKFSFYKIEKNVKNQIIYSIDDYSGVELPVINLFDSDQYKQDWLGLRTLFESDRLHIFETNCTHSGHKTEACFPQLEDITLPFL
jgi:palmitoyl-protein thioesterase